MSELFFVVCCFLLAERVWKYVLVKWFFQRALPSVQAQDKATISILQPILSGDPTLWPCLAQNLKIKSRYGLEFLWLVDSDDDLALSGCQQLMAQYPERNIQLITLPPPPDGISPKTFKLIAGLKKARGEVIAVLDDDTMLPDGGFEMCVPFLSQPGVGLAFGLPYYVNFSNVWSALVSCFVNSHSLLTYIPYTFLIEPMTINGMFYVVKRDILERAGGFAGLESAVCDDYAIARRFRAHNYRLAQTPLCHGITTQVQSFGHYLSLLKRWLVFPQISIMKTAPLSELAVFYSMAVLPPFFPLLVIGGVLLWPSRYAILAALLYFGFNFYMMVQFNRHYLYRATPHGKMIGMFVIQLLLPFQIFGALLRPGQINWRGHTLHLTARGRFHFVRRRMRPDQK